MGISMDISMDIHEKICGYGCGYGWEISYPRQACRLDTRREDITQSTFKEVKCPTHPLHYMLPPRKVSTSQMTLRSTYPFSAPKCKA